MAIELTKDYQQISTIPLTYGEIRTYAKYNSQNNESVKTYYNLKMTYYLRQWIEVSNATGTLDGTPRNYGYTRFNAGETTILELTKEILHNDDGTSPEITVNSNWNASFGGKGSTSAKIIMPGIDRLAIVTKANDFTDEENPTMEFNNLAGFKTYAYLYFYRQNDYSKEVFSITRNGEVANSPYQWELTEDEREQIRSALNDTTKYDVAIGVFTYDNDNNCLGQTNLVKKFTIINCDPIITLSCTEQNQKVKNIVGNEQIALNNVSQLKVEADITTFKNATVKKVLIQDEEIASPYTKIVDIKDNSIISGSVTDSRDLYNVDDYVYQLVDYRPVSIDSYKFKRENPTSSKIYLNAEITYWQIDLNGTANVPILSYSTDGIEFAEIPSSAYSINTTSHKIIISNYKVPTELAYNTQGTYYLKINDLFTEDNENEPVIKGIPVVDAGENDLQVNGEFFIADRDRQNKKVILDFCHPIGSYYETSDSEFNPNVYWGGTWELDNDGTTLASKSSVEGSIFNADLGTIVGEEKHTMTWEEMARHTHNLEVLSGYGYPNTAVGNDASVYDREHTYVGTGGYVPTTQWQAKTGTAQQVKTSGSSKPFSIVQPSKVVNRWHRIA